jgi:acyl-CoA thioester hydrolase
MSEIDSAPTNPASVVVQRRIEWPDTDASGHWHNTAGFRLIEVAETALLERLGILHEVYGRLPRVRINAEFKKLLNFRDVVNARISVAAVGRTSVTYDFRIDRDGQPSMEASVVAVLVDDHGRPRTWNDELRQRLLEAGPQGSELLAARTAPERPA